MNNYTFEELSPLRFEQLVRDLLFNQYGRFENFKEGKDGGIDFRCSISRKRVLVVQCKRYKSFNTLLSNLKKEALKLEYLSFDKYLLVVSLDLTPTNKSKIVEVFKNHIESDNIITNADLNALLGLAENSSIEYKYPELWMKSINIHQKLFQLGLLRHSDHLIEQILDVTKYYVPTKEYYELLEYLKKENSVIISGLPGVGKTTLGYSLISYYIYFEGYKLYDVSYRRISEIEALLYTDDKIIFFIDDFLGQIKVERTDFDASLLYSLIEKINKLKNVKLILTSRNYILQNAKAKLSAFRNYEIEVSEHTVELKSLSRRIKSEILFNHLKNSSLEIGYLTNILENDYKRIIDHRNYSPRIIEHLTKRIQLIKTATEDNYFNEFIRALDYPNEIWKHVYDNLPNDLYRLVLVIRFLSGEDAITYDQLEKEITLILENEPRFQHYSLDEYEHIIRDLEGTFFYFEEGYDELIEEHYENILTFINPSILDFFESFIWKKNSWLKIIIKHTMFFETLFNWELVGKIELNSELLSIFRKKVLQDFENLTNLGYGYYSHDLGDEGPVNSWTLSRRLQYLNDVSNLFDLKQDLEIVNFLKTELFRYDLVDEYNIPEIMYYFQVATSLIKLGHIDGREVIEFYLGRIEYPIKELVYLEYFTRHCDKSVIKLLKKDKDLVEYADLSFLNVLKRIKKMHFMDVSDFLDDYTQISGILPLKKTTKEIERLGYLNILESSTFPTEKKERKKKQKEDEEDIDDKSIDLLFKKLL